MLGPISVCCWCLVSFSHMTCCWCYGIQQLSWAQASFSDELNMHHFFMQLSPFSSVDSGKNGVHWMVFRECVIISSAVAHSTSRLLAFFLCAGEMLLFFFLWELDRSHAFFCESSYLLKQRVCCPFKSASTMSIVLPPLQTPSRDRSEFTNFQIKRWCATIFPFRVR